MTILPTRTIARLAATVVLGGSLTSLSACQYIQFLPFLKRQVNTDARGERRTERGPAFAAGMAGSATGAVAEAGADWPSYNGSPTAERASPLSQITAANVGTLRVACSVETGETGPMQSGPVVVGGTMYFTTAVSTYAADAATCAVRWKHQYRYSPKPDYDLKVNRGVAYVETPDGPRLVRGANDGRVYAMDARTGEEVWNVLAGDVGAGESFPAAPVAWGGLVYMGNAGGDNYAVTGRMMAFDARTGARVWSFELVPRSGEASLTWPAETNKVPRAGGTTWTSYTLDTARAELYVPTGNAAPDFLSDVRAGTNMFTYSIVVLDARTGAFRRVYKLLPTDAHDYDVAAAPLLITTAGGQTLVAAAGKDGHLYGIERDAERPRWTTPTTTLLNDTVPPTRDGVRFCPGVQGGTEWNGPAYLRATNLLYVAAVDWCTTVHVAPAKQLKNKRGIPWTGSAKLAEPFGKMDPKGDGRGWLTAVDADAGTVRWRYHAPTPLVAGVLATAGGFVMTADLAGDVVAFDAATGAERMRLAVGEPVGGGVITYAVGGRQYIAVAAGLDAPLSWRTKSAPAKVVVLALP